MFTAAKIKATHGKGADFFRQHLSCNDYYSEHDRVVGHWNGSLACALGLNQEIVSKEVFSLFQQNINPVNHSKLTPRNNPKAVRFYDFQCSAQKSVSIMSLFDSRLVKAHQEALAEAMLELEKFAAVRIRKGANVATNNFAYTGKFIYAQYHHENSRLLDPQLHTHNVIVNVTQDLDGSFKALDASEMYRSVRYAGKTYQNLLARKCKSLGYEIELKRSDKGVITGFEIAGISDEIIQRCSRRRAQIDKGIEKFVADNGRRPNAEEIKTITLQTRERKMLEKTADEVKDLKLGLLSSDEQQNLRDLYTKARKKGALGAGVFPSIEVCKAQIKPVLEQMFERHSVVRMDEVLAEVQNQNLGKTLIGNLRQAMNEMDGLVNFELPSASPYYTTEENIALENLSVKMVNNSKDNCPSLTSSFKPFSDGQDTFDHTNQCEVINTILSSTDQFMLFRGVAGAGKTSTLQELCKGLKAGGIQHIHIVAPTNSAVDVLRSEGFNSAQTVAMFLQNTDKLPPRGSYLIIDESGLNSLKQGAEIINLASENDYRVLFVGDERQHSSVEAGDFFRLLERHSMIAKTTLTDIFRQQTKEYKEGIELIASGQSQDGFEHLDAHGFIHANKGAYLAKAAESFLDFTDNGKRPLDCIAACPTIKECDSLTAMIREKLKQNGTISAENTAVESFKSWGWTRGQIGDIANYKVGTKIFFTTKVKNVAKAGEMAEVIALADGHLLLSNGQKICPDLIRNAIDVGGSAQLPVGKGDIVRFTVNLRTSEYKINNGSLAIATGNPNEYRLLDSNRRELTTIKLPESFKGIKYGWVMTSHSAQGMTSKNVVVAAEQMSKQAFYVACSRGKFKLALHVPDKDNFKAKLENLRTERLLVHDLSERGIVPPAKTVAEIKFQCNPEIGDLFIKPYLDYFRRVFKHMTMRSAKVFADWKNKLNISKKTHERMTHDEVIENNVTGVSRRKRNESVIIKNNQPKMEVENEKPREFTAPGLDEIERRIHRQIENRIAVERNEKEPPRNPSGVPKPAGRKPKSDRGIGMD